MNFWFIKIEFKEPEQQKTTKFEWVETMCLFWTVYCLQNASCVSTSKENLAVVWETSWLFLQRSFHWLSLAQPWETHNWISLILLDFQRLQIESLLSSEGLGNDSFSCFFCLICDGCAFKSCQSRIWGCQPVRNRIVHCERFTSDL